MAYDLDKSVQNSALTYRLVTENSLFALDPDSGRLYTKSIINYEKLSNPNFTLTIECSDQGEREKLKSQLTIAVNVLDLNDNAPQFERPNQTLIFKENFPLGQEITKLRVFDKDGTPGNQGPFSFQIIDDEQDQGFAIRKNGSLILTKRPLRNITYYLNGQ